MTYYYAIIYASFFVWMLVFSLLINGLLLRFSRTLGGRHHDDGTIIRWGAQSKPAMGGISFYIGFLLSVACYFVFFKQGQFLINTQLLGMMLATSLGFLMGLADDAYDTKPLLKLSVQLACGFILILSGVQITISAQPILNYAITLLWVVGVMNSVNMLDNMDGITSLISVSILLSVILILLLGGDFENIHLMLLIGVAASVLGFLYFNWHPSRMYMGDTGSQFLGVFLAAIGILYFWNDRGFIPDGRIRQFLLPVTAFIMPIIDTTVVVLNRISRKHSPFVGGKDHTTHNLVYLGLTDRQVAFLFTGISLLAGCSALYIIFGPDEWTQTNTFLFSAPVIILFLLFFLVSKIAHKRQEDKRSKR